MPNTNGSLYGLTILSPILNDEKVVPSHDLQIREYLAKVTCEDADPFAKTTGTHLCRLVVMDDVVFVGAPSAEEHLKSKYLIFECNLDAANDNDLDNYLRGLAETIPEHLDAVWKHCAGYPGASNVPAFISYMKSCQIETTFFFAAVNNKTLPQSLRALQTQRAVADFIAAHQGMEPRRLQAEFVAFAAKLKAEPLPKPDSVKPRRDIKMGGHNE